MGARSCKHPIQKIAQAPEISYTFVHGEAIKEEANSYGTRAS